MAGLSCPTRDSRGDCTPGPKMEIVSAPPDFFPGSYKSQGLSLGEMLAPTVPRMKGKGQRAKGEGHDQTHRNESTHVLSAHVKRQALKL